MGWSIIFFLISDTNRPTINQHNQNNQHDQCLQEQIDVCNLPLVYTCNAALKYGCMQLSDTNIFVQDRQIDRQTILLLH